jgi:hypothetical protein
LPTLRCLLRGGSFDGQLRVVAAGPSPTLILQHELDGEWWAETYTHNGVAEAPTFGLVRDLVFRDRCPVGGDRHPTRDREG